MRSRGQAPFLAAIVGVVQDVRYNGLAGATAPTLYTSFLQREQVAFFSRLDLVVRTAGDPKAFTFTLRNIVRRTDNRLATFGIAMMEEQLNASVARPRLYSGTVACFAALSLVVAAIGLHGALAYAVTVRRREIAIRRALGAAAGAVVRLVMRDLSSSLWSPWRSAALQEQLLQVISAVSSLASMSWTCRRW